MNQTKKKNGLSLRNLYSMYIGLLPWMMIYKFPFGNFSVVVFLAFLFIPYILTCLWRKQGEIDTCRSLVVLVFFLYYAYSVSNSLNSVILLLVVLLHVIIAPKSICYEKLVSTIKTFALISSIAIILQIIIYMLTGYTLPFILYDFVSDIFKGASGLVDYGKSFVRVSGFFVEPSHFATYSLVALSFYLFDKRVDKKTFKRSVILTLGIIASTSGIGLLGGLVLWAYYFISIDKLYFKTSSKLSKIILFSLIGVLITASLYFTSNGFQQSVHRITGASDDGYNAIDGRTWYNEYYLTQLSGNSLLYGMNFMEFEYFAAGYIKIIMFSGIIGFCLLILSNIVFLPKNRLSIKVIIGLFIGLLFFHDQVGAMSLLFYYVIFNSNNNEKSRLFIDLRAQK